MRLHETPTMFGENERRRSSAFCFRKNLASVEIAPAIAGNQPNIYHAGLLLSPSNSLNQIFTIIERECHEMHLSLRIAEPLSPADGPVSQFSRRLHDPRTPPNCRPVKDYGDAPRPGVIGLVVVARDDEVLHARWK